MTGTERGDSPQASDDVRAAVRDTARLAYAAGLCTLPAAANGSKMPGVRTWRGYQKVRPDLSTMGALFPREGGPVGLGLVTGFDRLEMLEFDAPEAEAAVRAIAATHPEAAALIAKLDAGYSERTPGGGLHWLYRHEGEPEGNTKLAMHEGKVWAETRGTGGWTIIAPSAGTTHPSGLPYVLLAGTLDTIPTLTAAERALLWGIVRSNGEVVALPTPRASPVRARPEGDDERPGDVFNRTATWPEIMEPHRWRQLRTRGGGVIDWLHPDAPKGGALDATTNHDGHDLLYVFSTNAPPFEPEVGIDKFGAWALLNHGGDIRAAALALAATYDPYDGGPLGAPSKAPEVAASDVVDIAPQEDASGEFGGGQNAPKGAPFVFDHAFPSDHFVTKWIEYAVGLTDGAGEYQEAAALIALAACTEGVRAKLGPWPRGLPTTLYALLIGETSTSRKTTSIDHVIDILGTVRASSILAGSTSPEALMEHLATKGMIGTMWPIDEIGRQMADWGRGGGKMIETVLKAYAGSPMVYARVRKKGTDGAMHEDGANIERPHMSILGATTPAIFNMPGLAERRDEGLIPRFAIVLGHTRPPKRAPDVITERDENARADLIDRLNAIVQWVAGGDYTFAKFAPGVIGEGGLLSEYGFALDDRAARFPILGRISAMAYKVAMLSACGHGEGVAGSTLLVTREDAEAAIKVCDRWAANAVAFSLRLSSGVDRDAERRMAVLAWTREQGGSVTRRAVMRKFGLSARSTDEYRAALEGAGYITVAKVAGAKGPAAEVWVHVGGSR